MEAKDLLAVDDKFSLQIVSDIHLETRSSSNCIIIKKHANNIALLGDIGNLNADMEVRKYKFILNQLAQEFERVFLIPGNHEYYGKLFTMPEYKEKLKKMCDECGVILLDNTKYEIPEYNLVILGSTLWTAGNTKIKPRMNDYNYIKYDKKNLLTTQHTYDMHQTAVNWISSEINENKDKQIIILSHHAPLLEGISNSAHAGDECKIFYGTDLSHLMGDPVKVWAFGHTHYNTEFSHKGTKIVTNAMGYSTESLNYKPDCVIYIEKCSSL